ncbi:MAG: hypothetical protein ISQ08_11205 [Planctomycetes bacterium]|nr:hypothetical protein [Planctomycetota bacterium]
MSRALLALLALCASHSSARALHAPSLEAVVPSLEAMVPSLKAMVPDRAASSAPAPEAADRLHLARLRLEGPAEQVTVECGELGRTVWTGNLRAGEVRTLLLPLVAPVDAARAARGELEAVPDEERAVPPWLARRAAPAPPGSSRRLPRTPALALFGAWVAALLLRRSASWVLLAVGLAGATLVALAPTGVSQGRLVRVLDLEGAGPTARWGVTEAAFGSLTVPRRDGEVHCAAAGGLVYWVTEGEPSWRLEAGAGELLVRREALEGRPPVLEPELQALGALERTWLRGAAGWVPCGAWELGAAQPRRDQGAPGGGAPPGWLVAGLPQGYWVAVGELRGQVPGPSTPPAAASWLRAVGRPLDPGSR